MGILVIENPHTTKRAQAFGGGGEMISADGKGGVWHLKDGKVRRCPWNGRCTGWY